MNKEAVVPSLPDPQSDAPVAADTGFPMPLGTYTWGAGTNVAVFSRDAVRVWLELYDDNRNEIGWWIWDRLDEHDEIHRFVKELIAARMAHSPLRHGGFYTDESLQWVGPEGQSPRWDDPASRALGCYVPKKEELAVLLLFNAGLEPATFELPPLGVDRVWQRKADTSLPSPEDIHPLPSSPALDEQERYTLSPRTSVVLIAEL